MRDSLPPAFWQEIQRLGLKLKSAGSVRNAIAKGEKASLSYSRRPLACVSFGVGMTADVRVLSAFSPLDGRYVYERVGGMTTGGGAFLPRRSGAEG